MKMEIFSCLELHLHWRTTTWPTGFLTTVSFSSRPPNFYLQNAKCPPPKSTPSWIFGPALSIHTVQVPPSLIIAICSTRLTQWLSGMSGGNLFLFDTLGRSRRSTPYFGCHKNMTSGFETLVSLCIKYLLILVLRMVDLCPFQEYTTDDQIQQYKDFMSGDWAWDQAVCFLTLFWSYWLTHANRTPYPRMRALLGVHSSLSFWVVIKRQFQLLQATMSTIRCICPLGMFTTVYDEHIGMHSSWSASWQYPKVGFFLSPLNVTH